MRRFPSAITTLHVRLLRATDTTGRLDLGTSTLPCTIGRAGLTHRKHEGDGATPAGRLRLLSGIYRPDRIRVRPKAALPLRPMRPSDGWGDQPGDPRYNRPLRRPYAGGHEALWRDDHLYDLVVVLDWNIAPRARHRGSAIFLHVARPDSGPTAGCVAVSRPALLRLVARLHPKAVIVAR